MGYHNRISLRILLCSIYVSFHFTALGTESIITISGNPEDVITNHVEQTWNAISIQANSISKNTENSFDHEFRTFSLLAEPFENATFFIGSISSSGLYSRARNPLPQKSSVKPPAAQKPLNTSFSHSQTSVPGTGGYTIAFPLLRVGFSVDLHTLESRIPDFTQNPEQFGVFIETPKTLSFGPFQFKGGILSNIISRTTEPAYNWYPEKTDLYSPLIHFSLADGWIRWKKASARFNVFRRSSPILHPQHAIRLEADYQTGFATLSSGIFYCQPDFTDVEHQSPAATARIYIGFNSEWKISSFRSPLILLSGIVSREKMRKDSWHSTQQERLSAGTRSIVKFRLVSIENEYIYCEKAIEQTHQIRFRPHLPGNPTARLKATFNDENMLVSTDMTIKPYKGLFLKTASFFEIIDQNIETSSLIQTIRYGFTRKKLFSSCETAISIPINKSTASFSFSATIARKN